MSDRTITASALSKSQPAECHTCGATEPRKDLWGCTERGSTTGSLAEVHHWTCAECFAAGGKPRQCMYIDETQNPEIYGGYVPSLVRAGVAGHRPMTGATVGQRPWVWGKTLDEAQAACDAYNRKTFNLSKLDAWKIVNSSIELQIKEKGLTR